MFILILNLFNFLHFSMSHEEFKDDLNTDKLMKSISMIEENTIKINKIKNKINENDEAISNNKKLIKYLMEHTEFKDNELNILIPGNIFEKIERKNAVQLIQSQIDIIQKENIQNKEELNYIKDKFIESIENVNELNFVEPNIFSEIFPLIKKKFPNEFKQKNDDSSDDDD